MAQRDRRYPGVNQALNKTLDSSVPGLVNVDNATIAGIRFRIRF